MTARPGTRCSFARVRAFVQDTRAGATAIASAAVTVMTVGAAALITDHVWLYDQRDVLKTAAEAASIAATLDFDRQLAVDPGISDADLTAKLLPVAKRYLLVNLAHLPSKRFTQAKDSLEATLDLDRAQRTVSVTARADLGGTLFARNLPLLGNYEGPEKVAASAGVESESTPVEVVLAIDTSTSMRMPLAGGSYNVVESRSRMGIVKRAAERLVDILEPNAHNRVAIGVVPWDISVRLDEDTASAWAHEGWAHYPDERTYPYPWHCFNCTVEPVVDDLPDDPPSEWRGCLGEYRVGAGDTARLPDLSGDDNAAAAALFATPASSPFAQHFFPSWPEWAYRCRDASEMPSAPSYACYETHLHLAQDGCSSDHSVLHALSTDTDAIEDAIDALSPAESRTYSTLGVLWAQRMLEPDWKSVWGGAVHPAGHTTGVRKAIVLLTDGEDAYCDRQRFDCVANGLSISRAKACTLAKKRGTEIFVVAAMNPRFIGGSSLETELTACSSKADNPDGEYVFLDNTDAADLEAAFANIASQLRTLRKVS